MDAFGWFKHRVMKAAQALLWSHRSEVKVPRSECSTWPVSANLSRSDNEDRTKALLLSAPESAPSSLKFTTCLLTEGTWQACAQANSQPHTTSSCCLSHGLESHCLCIRNQDSWGCADLWMPAFLTPRLVMLLGGKLTSKLSRSETNG